jgi:hypothetical protein
VIAELEARVARPPVGVLPPLAGICLLASLFLMWWQLPEVVYFFSERVPLELGAEGDYHLDRAVSNHVAQLRGAPLARGWYTVEPDGDFVLVAIADTPLMVRRPTFPDEAPTREGKRPRPRQHPLFARGRLLALADSPRYASVLAEASTWSGTPLQWVLLVDQLPGRDAGSVAWFGVLGAFGALNAWLLVRGVRR